MSVTTIPNGSSRVATPGAGTMSTSPGTAGAQGMAGAGYQQAGYQQAGQQQGGFQPQQEQLAAVVAGVATQYWAELIPIPAGPARLWFFVDNGWRVLNGPTSTQFNVVQRAFLGSGSTVRVWYDGTTVAGLVVSG
jgi:hypothetical protein